MPNRDFLVEALVKQAAGSRVDADFGFDAFGANPVAFGIDPALGLQVRCLDGYRSDDSWSLIPLNGTVDEDDIVDSDIQFRVF